MIGTVVSIMGALCGVLMGGWLQSRVRRQEWTRDDRVRWHEIKRSHYSEFMDAMRLAIEDLMSSTVDSGDRPKALQHMSPVQAKLSELQLLASSRAVIEAAGEFAVLYVDARSCHLEIPLALNNESPEELEALLVDKLQAMTALLKAVRTLRTTQARFVSAARKELDLPDVDVSIESIARTVAEVATITRNANMRSRGELDKTFQILSDEFRKARAVETS